MATLTEGHNTEIAESVVSRSELQTVAVSVKDFDYVPAFGSDFEVAKLFQTTDVLNVSTVSATIEIVNSVETIETSTKVDAVQLTTISEVMEL